MTPKDREILRTRLLTYPGVDGSNVEQHLWAYEEREEEKEQLLARGMSNALAETTLDRQGYPRPPGWSSVFFYPGGMVPRPGTVIVIVALAAALWWFGKF